MSASVVALVFLVLVGVTIALGVRIVPQGSKHVVQRLGKYQKTLGPGLNLIVPYMDTVAYRVTTKDIVMDIPSQEVITRDNAVIIANAIAYINIVSPEKAVYGVENYTLAIQSLVQTSLRSIVGEMDLDDALSSRDAIKAKLKAAISDDIADWGITLKTVEIQDIKPSPTMQHAMEEGQRIVQIHFADDGTQRGLHQVLDGQDVVLDAVHRLFRRHDVDVGDGVGNDHRVVAGDDFL